MKWKIDWREVKEDFNEFGFKFIIGLILLLFIVCVCNSCAPTEPAVQSFKIESYSYFFMDKHTDGTVRCFAVGKVKNNETRVVVLDFVFRIYDDLNCAHPVQEVLSDKLYDWIDYWEHEVGNEIPHLNPQKVGYWYIMSEVLDNSLSVFPLIQINARYKDSMEATVFMERGKLQEKYEISRSF